MGTNPLTNKPYTVYSVDRVRRRWPRILLSIVVVLVALMGLGVGGTYLWLDAKLQATTEGPDASLIAEILDSTTTVPVDDAASAEADPTLENPEGQDILVLGSDKRTKENEEYGRSDTIMVVHLDPDNGFVSVLSIPRDLRVEIPGYGLDKINAAYALGGTALTIQTVQQLTHIDLDHYVNIDFRAFKDITSALDGGIWMDVDRRYYYDGDAYENINIPPGYQKLAGEEALDWVRFRHDQNYDFGRIMRQHRFLRAAKEQISKWNAALKIPTMVDILAQNVYTDISTTQALRMAFWGVRLGSDNMHQVEIEGLDTADIGGASYVLADESMIRDAVRRLLEPPVASGSASPVTDGGGEEDPGAGESTEPTTASTTTTLTPVDLTGMTVVVLNGNGHGGEAAAAGDWLAHMGADISRVGDASRQDYEQSRVYYPPGEESAAATLAAAAGVERVSESGSVERVTLVLGGDFQLPEEYRPSPSVDDAIDSDDWRGLGAEATFPLMAPTYLPEGFSKFRDRKYGGQRLYDIPTEDGPQAALKVVYRLYREDQYLGIMETTFTKAPAAAPGKQVVRDGVTYTIVHADGRPERVWWERDGVLYWVSNTLMYTVDEEELLAVAAGMVPVS
jgi:LCP family protein required for cell wall assembly